MNHKQQSKGSWQKQFFIAAVCFAIQLPGFSQKNKTEYTDNHSLVNTEKSAYSKLEALPIEEVTWTSGFLADRVKTAYETMLPSMWAIYNDAERSHAVRNFEIAAGIYEGPHEGAPFHDGDFYKLIEAASMAYAVTGDEQYKDMIDEVLPVIKASQREDGYIHTPVMIDRKNNPEKAQEFRDRMDFETYNMGHLMTAGCLHYKVTGETELLDMAIKAANYLYNYCTKFPEKLAGNAICPSHYMGVVELYRTTQDTKYLELAKQLIDIRGMVQNGTDHNQDRIPFREQTEAIGHAVRANYLYAGVADVYAETGDETLKTALDAIWDNLTSQKLYITGGCGALYDGVSPNGTSYNPAEIHQVHQAYGSAYQLPSASAHNETCANIGSALWNYRMLQTTGEAKYADLMERTLYNSVLSGVNLNGKGYFYTNPLSNMTELPFEYRWSNVREDYISLSNCCPPNTIRTILELSTYLYSKNDEGIWLNMYGASKVNTTISGQALAFEQTSNYPWEGNVKLAITKAPKKAINLSFRVPEWSNEYSLSVNGEKITNPKFENGYVSINKAFKKGDVVTFEMDMSVMMLEANPLVEETKNQVAIQRGPIVYSLEANDLPGNVALADVMIPADIQLNTENITIANVPLTGLKGEAVLKSKTDWNGKLYQPLRTAEEKISITLIPHFAWANREEADMSIWLPVIR